MKSQLTACAHTHTQELQGSPAPKLKLSDAACTYLQDTTVPHRLHLLKPVWPLPESFQDALFTMSSKPIDYQRDSLRGICKTQRLLPMSDIKVGCYPRIIY